MTTDPATSPTSGLPHLVFELEGFPPARAHEDYPTSGPTGPTGPPNVGLVQWLYTDPDEGFGGRALFVTVVDAGIEFGLGERSPIATQQQIGASTGYLQRSSAAPT